MKPWAKRCAHAAIGAAWGHKKEGCTDGSARAFVPPLVYATIAPLRRFDVRPRYAFGN